MATRHELNRIKGLGFWNRPGEGEVKEIVQESQKLCLCNYGSFHLDLTLS